MRRVALLSLSSLFACGLAILLVSGGAFAQDDAPEEPAPRDPTSPGQPAPDVAEPERSAEDLERRAGVVARVGEVTITVGQVEDAINEQSPFVRVRYRAPEQLREFVQSMIRFELLARAAERAEIDEIEDVQHAVKQNAVQQLIRRDFDERITVDSVPQADVQAYYDSHPAEFNTAELRRAAHIRVGSREEAERLLAEAQAADARAFRVLAREHSGDPATSLRGGDLRYFDEDGRPRNARDPQVDEGLARAAFALEEVGDVAAEPVQMGEFWSIVKLTGRRPPDHRSLEQSSPTIRLRIWRQNRQGALEDFVAELRRTAGISDIPYEALRGIRLDPPEREDLEAPRHGAPPPATLQDVAPNAPAPGPSAAPADDSEE